MSSTLASPLFLFGFLFLLSLAYYLKNKTWEKAVKNLEKTAKHNYDHALKMGRELQEAIGEQPKHGSSRTETQFKLATKAYEKLQETFQFYNTLKARYKGKPYKTRLSLASDWLAYASTVDGILTQVQQNSSNVSDHTREGNSDLEKISQELQILHETEEEFKKLVDKA